MLQWHDPSIRCYVCPVVYLVFLFRGGLLPFPISSIEAEDSYFPEYATVFAVTYCSGQKPNQKTASWCHRVISVVDSNVLCFSSFI